MCGRNADSLIDIWEWDSNKHNQEINLRADGTILIVDQDGYDECIPAKDVKELYDTLTRLYKEQDRDDS